MLKNMKMIEILFVALLVLYLVSGVSTPYNLSPYINNIYTYACLIAITALLFLHSSPYIAVFFAVVAAVFINRARQISYTVMAPSQASKDAKMTDLNTFLHTRSLEEEVVGQIVREPDNMPNPSSYHPIMCDTKNALDF